MSRYGSNSGDSRYDSRYDSRNDSRRGSHADNGEALGKADTQALIQHSIDEGTRALQEHHYSDDPDKNTVSYLGFKIDSGIASALKGVWSALSGELSGPVSRSVYKTVLQQGPKLKISGTALAGPALYRTAAAATLAANLGIFLGPAALTFGSDVRRQHEARSHVVRQLAPVLDDIVGKHSVAAYNSIGPDLNSVLWAHRQRMRQEASATNSTTVLTALGQQALNIAHQAINVRSLVVGKHRDEVFRTKNKDDYDKIYDKMVREAEQDLHWEHERRHRGEKDHESSPGLDEAAKIGITEKATAQLRKEHENEGGRVLFMGANFSFGPLIEKLAESSRRRFERSRQPYSALEMIVCLSEQLQNNPGHSDRFQLPGQRGRELPLKQYVAEIFKHHQREMCDLNPNYSELRQSLHEDLDQLVTPIAEALRDGKLSPLMLARLAGERKVIKNHGRGLTSPTELLTTLEDYSGKSHRIHAVDAKEYLSDRNFSLHHVKESLDSLKGAERLDYAAVLPDSVLQAAGMGDKEIKQVQQHRTETTFKQAFKREILAIAAKPDEDLKAGGLGSAQIEKLRQAAETLEERGVEAFDSLMSGPTNADGVDNVIADFVVPKVAGDKAYYGKLIEQGKNAAKQEARHEEMPDAANDGAEDEKPVHHRKGHAQSKDHRKLSHADEHDHRRKREAANHGHSRGVSNG